MNKYHGVGAGGYDCIRAPEFVPMRPRTSPVWLRVGEQSLGFYYHQGDYCFFRNTVLTQLNIDAAGAGNYINVLGYRLFITTLDPSGAI